MKSRILLIEDDLAVAKTIRIEGDWLRGNIFSAWQGRYQTFSLRTSSDVRLQLKQTLPFEREVRCIKASSRTGPVSGSVTRLGYQPKQSISRRRAASLLIRSTERTSVLSLTLAGLDHSIVSLNDVGCLRSRSPKQHDLWLGEEERHNGTDEHERDNDDHGAESKEGN